MRGTLGLQIERDLHEGFPSQSRWRSGREDLLEAVRKALQLGLDVLLFERDKDKALTGMVTGRKALRLVAHRAKQISVYVRYEPLTKEEKPSDPPRRYSRCCSGQSVRRPSAWTTASSKSWPAAPTADAGESSAYLLGVDLSGGGQRILEFVYNDGSIRGRWGRAW